MGSSKWAVPMVDDRGVGGLVNGQGLGCRGRESGRGLGEREVERAYEI